MKKITKTLASVALGASLLLSIAAGASAATYTVKSGDSLYSIAQEFGTTYTEIMKLNGLTSTVIYPGQKLEVNGTPSSSSVITYTVKSGDTLYNIAKQYGTTYTEIMELNGLTSSMIVPGQKLIIKGAAPSSASINAKAVNIAKQYIGVPYVFGGTTPSGFDCSGLIYYSFKNAGKPISRLTAEGYYNISKKVSTPEVGDLVFFSNTYKNGISHVGIYIGNGQMISATSSKGVTIASIQSSYWKSHFSGYGRL